MKTGRQIVDEVQAKRDSIDTLYTALQKLFPVCDDHTITDIEAFWSSDTNEAVQLLYARYRTHKNELQCLLDGRYIFG